MREHDAAARRMVVGGAVVLAAALGALVLAGVAVRRLDREAVRREAESRLRADVAFSLHWIARGAPDDWTELLDARFAALGGGDDEVHPPPRPFDLLPEVRDAEARFLLAQADGDGPPALRRAALRLAARCSDPAARLCASARLAASHGPADVAGFDVTTDLAETREAVLVGLLRGDAGARARAEQAIGTEDDEAAASLLITSPGADRGAAIARVGWLRLRAGQVAKISAVLPDSPTASGPPAPSSVRASSPTGRASRDCVSTTGRGPRASTTRAPPRPASAPRWRFGGSAPSGRRTRALRRRP